MTNVCNNFLSLRGVAQFRPEADCPLDRASTMCSYVLCIHTTQLQEPANICRIHL